MMVWQQQLVQELRDRLPAGAAAEVVGSATDPDLLDGWSDVDLGLRLPHPVELAELVPGPGVWAAEVTESAEGQVARVVWTDGRRADFLVRAGQLLLPEPSRDNDVRFIAALAVAKLGRRDRLIGLHLALELQRACLVQAMLLRDRAEGTRYHRFGTDRDDLADEVAGTPVSLDVSTRPNVVEQTVERYGRWRGELEADYRPDWSGLSRVIDRGLAAC